MRDDIKQRLTPEILAAFEAGDADALDRLLGLRPWETSPLDADGECPYGPGSGAAQSWPAAVALRKAILDTLERRGK